MSGSSLSGPAWRRDDGGDVRCGIDSFFTPGDEPKRLERGLARRGAIARIEIDGAGRAALVDLERR